MTKIERRERTRIRLEKEALYRKLNKQFRKETKMPYALAYARAAKIANGGKMPKVGILGGYIWD